MYFLCDSGLGGQKEDIKAPGAGVTGSGELPAVGAGNSGPLQQQ